MNEQDDQKVYDIKEITGYSMDGAMRLGVMPNPMRNAVEISFFWTPRNSDKVYVADFTGLKFKEAEFAARRGDGKEVDAIQISADYLKTPTDQMIYAAGMHGLCEMSQTERQAYKDHIKDLQEQNARLMAMVAGVIPND
jgi:hypothetical protein